MRHVAPWHNYFMDLALAASKRSKDPSTQVGAILVDEHNHVFMTGYNGFAPGAHESHTEWSRPVKYPKVIHAEVNAIGHAARKGSSTEGATLYVTHFPCENCAKVIVAAGIKRVMALQNAAGWDESHDNARCLFDTAGIAWECWT